MVELKNVHSHSHSTHPFTSPLPSFMESLVFCLISCFSLIIFFPCPCFQCFHVCTGYVMHGCFCLVPPGHNCLSFSNYTSHCIFVAFYQAPQESIPQLLKMLTTHFFTHLDWQNSPNKVKYTQNTMSSGSNKVLSLTETEQQVSASHVAAKPLTLLEI